MFSFFSPPTFIFKIYSYLLQTELLRANPRLIKNSDIATIFSWLDLNRLCDVAVDIVSPIFDRYCISGLFT